MTYKLVGGGTVANFYIAFKSQNAARQNDQAYYSVCRDLKVSLGYILIVKF